MTLTPLADLSAADWFVEAECNEWTKICLGPPGYEAYARVRLYPADEDDDLDLAQITAQALRGVLPRHTATPADCYFAQWDGCGWDPPVPATKQTFPSIREVVRYQAFRRYHLFSGTLDDSASWDGGDPPHLMWPADRAWFVAADVDPGWIGISGSQLLIDQVLAEPTLDAAPSAYDASHWEDE